MSKSVLISIQPKWCELITKGEKTLEVRKTRPKLKTPFKCYIYCTNNQVFAQSSMEGEYFTAPKSGLRELELCGSKILSSKVIGEFVCDEIERVDIPYPAYQDRIDKRYIEQSCVPYNALHRYCYHDDAYFWHISDFKIYDKPKDLSEFFYACNKPKGTDCSACLDHRENKCKSIIRPPQSWCYVSEVNNYDR